MKKPKVLFIVGSGASVDFDFPTVAQIDEFFSEWSNEYPYVPGDQKTYSLIRGIVNTYYNQNPKSGLVKSTNFEEILYLYYQLHAIASDSNWELYRNPLAALIKECRVSMPQPFDGYLSLANYLIDRLLEHFRDHCKQVRKKKESEFGLLLEFLNAFSDQFEIGFVSLNYDNLITQALPDLCTGFDKDTGRFQPKLIYERKEWNFIYHLHGSVHFDMRFQNHNFHVVHWQNDLEEPFQQNSSGRSSQNTMEGVYLPTSSIIAGYNKLDQIQKDPYRIYFCELDRLVYEANFIVFLGYGFGDFHLNRAFRSIRQDKPAKKILVISYEKEDQDPLHFRRDEWSHNLSTTIPFNAGEMATYEHSCPSDIEELKREKQFEISRNPDYPLSVWYGGFLEACMNVEKVIDELNRNAVY